MTWLLRTATAADIDGIMALETSIFESDAWSTENMTDEVTGDHRYYLVAVTEAGVIEGYAGLLSPLRAPDADIQTIAVAPSARRHGLGRTLMLALINEARRRGAEQVFLEVRADNPGAQTLYTSLGFDRIGVRAGYYQPDNVDAIIMRLRVPDTEVTPA
ncbi:MULTISPECIES: ribosomal protein S18-alanine N-acetyltransferase [unclassified Diaminobutyricimonas]|uniref:ribosomal protein S18-alanine N-acetyltransferase n=1 Tax=unclassified Diaminobutyricimonas TaxID=2643261 RepID=UPI0012F4FB21|nr:MULTISPECIES: ribosomal protein S18-alanine N-acetyltransferase [unclassified Diaminobutyricimonas]